ncbi:MAG: DUF1294 domain-containing protein [Geminicoccaceae bacterium]
MSYLDFVTFGDGVGRWIMVLIAINLATFLLFGFDKFLAVRGHRRVPERHLLGLAFFGGATGGFVASEIFRHKTRKQPFRRILLALFVLNIVVLVMLSALLSGAWAAPFS